MVRLEEIWTLTSQTSFQVDREIRWTLTLTNKPQVGFKIGIKAYYYNFLYTNFTYAIVRMHFLTSSSSVSTESRPQDSLS